MQAPHGETVARALQRCTRIDDAYARGYATAADVRESERLLAIAIRRAAATNTTDTTDTTDTGDIRR